MKTRARNFAWSSVILLALLSAGCIRLPSGSGTFEKTLSVTGPVRLEVQNGSGKIQISPGAAGEVRIRGEFRVYAWVWEGKRSRVEEVKSNPPIEQHGNVIRVGAEAWRLRNLRVDYTIVVPAETEVRAGTGSGSIELRGVRGPAKLSTGSGHIQAEEIGDDTQVSTGSGSIDLADVRGDVQFSVGSGNVTCENVGAVRGNTGSGGIKVVRPGGRVVVEAGSGRIRVEGAREDVRVQTGSGSITVEGNPSSSSLWQVQTGSGTIEFDVPESASFRFYARSNSGGIHTDLPVVLEEKTRRELRARLGKGEARVEARTGSGSIHLQKSLAGRT